MTTWVNTDLQEPGEGCRCMGRPAWHRGHRLGVPLNGTEQCLTNKCFSSMKYLISKSLPRLLDGLTLRHVLHMPGSEGPRGIPSQLLTLGPAQGHASLGFLFLLLSLSRYLGFLGSQIFALTFLSQGLSTPWGSTRDTHLKK